ncbi:unnamed protein product [Oikopleura dioica]|uniref:Uncharacterized protein n=1 Tax=Oikopleura dioica TaxID=34765 RepID=E4X6S2_OIKDI|nr:unnamed protein product [Oikopleura dioica]
MIVFFGNVRAQIQRDGGASISFGLLAGSRRPP